MTKAAALNDAGRTDDAYAAIAEAAAGFAGSGEAPVSIDGLRCPEVAGLSAELEVYQTFADMVLGPDLEPAIRSATSEAHTAEDRITSLSLLRQTVTDLLG